MIEKRAVVNDDPETDGVVKEAMAKVIDNEKKEELQKPGKTDVRDGV